MNKNGYTLVELLTVIVIIGVLSTLAVISYSYVIRSSSNRVFESYIDTMHAEAVIYYTKNSIDAYRLSTTTPTRLSLNTLKVAEINNPVDKTDKCLNSYVDVTRNNNSSMISLTYNVCLKCNDYDKCKTYVD